MSNTIPANEFVTDTMGLVLRLEQRHMPAQVKAIFESAEMGQATIYIPALVFAEVLYLSERGRISLSINVVAHYMQQFPRYQEYPLSLAVIQTTSQITDIRELHDRLIAATARHLNLSLITNDPVIQASRFVQTVW